MERFIARRDFLQGTLYAAASTLSGPLLAGVADAAAAPGPSQDLAGYYPPSLTGLRGSHPGSFEAAHALRDGAAPAAAVPEADSYDLVIVGAGHQRAVRGALLSLRRAAWPHPDPGQS